MTQVPSVTPDREKDISHEALVTPVLEASHFNEAIPDSTIDFEEPTSGEPSADSSAPARHRAAVILEVLAGIVGPTEASQALQVSVQHYYLLERRALRGLLQGCEPPPKGPRGPGLEQQLAALKRELEECRRECLRQAALVRITQRAVGLHATQSAVSGSESLARKGTRKNGGKSVGGATNRTTGAGGSRRRKRRPMVRALRAVDALRSQSSSGSGKKPVLERSRHKSVRGDSGRESAAEGLGDKGLGDKEVQDGNASR